MGIQIGSEMVCSVVGLIEDGNVEPTAYSILYTLRLAQDATPQMEGRRYGLARLD